jgi:thymidylate synthase (FAD)
VEILYPPGKCEILAILGLDGENPLQLIELAGRTSYQSFSRIKEGSAEKFVEMLRRRGHESVIEHSAMTVRFSNVSRGFTHELVRHRLASYTQESTRYVDESNFYVVIPPDKNPDEKLVELKLPDGRRIRVSFRQWVELNEQMYRGLRQAGWIPQDARQSLPIGIRSQIVVTANFREWRHIFGLRGAPDAHWEIRLTMIELLKQVQRLVPIIFNDFEIDESVPCIRRIKD